ncbi:helix-turn-helix domain-containing protein [Sediminibacillus halophilus]|uniref:Helix-turn-helix domain-containing protein n=1 Tax=Sediminibacillus halophilus TaxID=482461 RepID=A0A1G9X5L9_9BACI|nr:helix-turn-helix domain-containing protein [Sediminibacillus halophilus]SDM91816.1 Helix-turn-helix domain-containing protein [Sediminibacillus halophilus]
MEEKSLYQLTTESKSNPSALIAILDAFEPKVKKSLYQTEERNREDMYQDLQLKMVEAVTSYDISTVPGFFDFQVQVESNIV